MDQKYTVAFSSNTNLVFIVALKIACFSISFSSIFKIIFHNSGARIVILYLEFCELKGRYNMIISRETGWVTMRRS